MNAHSPVRFGNRGFTLVELLVVIAIIGILASIVVPNVPKFIRKAKYADAVSEIEGIDLALVGILSDTGRSSFKEFLKPPGEAANVPALRKFYLDTGRSVDGTQPDYPYTFE